MEADDHGVGRVRPRLGVAPRADDRLVHARPAAHQHRLPRLDQERRRLRRRGDVADGRNADRRQRLLLVGRAARTSCW